MVLAYINLQKKDSFKNINSKSFVYKYCYYKKNFCFLLAMPTGSLQILVAVLIAGLGSRQHFWIPGQLLSNQQPTVLSCNADMPNGCGQLPGFALM